MSLNVGLLGDMTFIEALLSVLVIIAFIALVAFILVFLIDLLLSIIDPNSKGLFFRRNLSGDAGYDRPQIVQTTNNTYNYCDSSDGNVKSWDDDLASSEQESLLAGEPGMQDEYGDASDKKDFYDERNESIERRKKEFEDFDSIFDDEAKENEAVGDLDRYITEINSEAVSEYYGDDTGAVKEEKSEPAKVEDNDLPSFDEFDFDNDEDDEVNKDSDVDEDFDNIFFDDELSTKEEKVEDISFDDIFTEPVKENIIQETTAVEQPVEEKPAEAVNEQVEQETSKTIEENTTNDDEVKNAFAETEPTVVEPFDIFNEEESSVEQNDASQVTFDDIFAVTKEGQVVEPQKVEVEQQEIVEQPKAEEQPVQETIIKQPEQNIIINIAPAVVMPKEEKIVEQPVEEKQEPVKAEVEQPKVEETKQEEIVDQVTVVTKTMFDDLTLPQLENRLSKLQTRLKNNEKELKANRKEYMPLARVKKTLEKDQEKLRRREAIIARKKVILYGVNNYVDIDEEKAKKLSEELDLLDGLRLSVQHCEDVMTANKDRFPILEKTNKILTDISKDLKEDIAEIEVAISNYKKLHNVD